MTIEALKLREQEKLYPPKFIIMARRTNTAEYCRMDVRFQGATREIVKGIPLRIHEGIIQMILGLQICFYGITGKSRASSFECM